MASVRQFPTIKAIRSYVIGGVGSGMQATLYIETGMCGDDQSDGN